MCVGNINFHILSLLLYLVLVFAPTQNACLMSLKNLQTEKLYGDIKNKHKLNATLKAFLPLKFPTITTYRIGTLKMQ